MANILAANPMVFGTDFASYQAIQTLTDQKSLLGLRIRKIALYVGAAPSSAGTVTVTDPITGNNITAPMVVAAASPIATLLYFDEFVSQLVWKDFAVTGLTATGTQLLVWFGR